MGAAIKVLVDDAQVDEYARRLRTCEPLGQVFPRPMSECDFTARQREVIRLARIERKTANKKNGQSSLPKAVQTAAPKPQASRALPKLARLLFLQSGRCFFCGEPLSEADASIEHLNPVSRGGSRTEDNEVVCHKTLNHAFGNMDLKSKFAFVLRSAGSIKCPKR